MNVFLAALGWFLVALTVVDVFRTVFWSGAGGGPLTGLITGAVHRGVRPLVRRSRTAMSALGPLALLVIAATWALTLLVGFTLTLQMDPDSVVQATTSRPASWSERAYVTGYNIFTLGNGDFAPATDLARTMFVVSSATGLFLITISVTYLVPVISASVATRSFAMSVLSLGSSAPEAIVEAWHGGRIELDHQLRRWDDQLGTIAQQHLAYPVLHLFTSARPSESAPQAVARLDDVLTLLDAVDQEVAPPRHLRRQLRSSIQRYVAAYGRADRDVDVPPSPPDLAPLRDAGIPLRVDGAGLAGLVAHLDDHRSRVREVAADSEERRGS